MNLRIKLMQLTCMLTALVAANQSLELAWLDLTINGNSDNLEMPSFKVDVPVSEQKNDCF